MTEGINMSTLTKLAALVKTDKSAAMSDREKSWIRKYSPRQDAHIAHLGGNALDFNAFNMGSLLGSKKLLMLGGVGLGASAGAGSRHYKRSKNKNRLRSGLVGATTGVGGIVGSLAGGLAGIRIPTQSRTPFLLSVAAGKILGGAAGLEAGLGINKLTTRRRK